MIRNAAMLTRQIPIDVCINISMHRCLSITIQCFCLMLERFKNIFVKLCHKTLVQCKVIFWNY